MIADAGGARTTPSVIAFTDSEERLVGQLARRQAILDPGPKERVRSPTADLRQVLVEP